MWIGAIGLVSAGTGIVPPPVVHLVTGFVKHLPHIGAEGTPLLPERRTPAQAVRPHQLEICKVASRDMINKDYIMKDVPCPLIIDAANIVYLYESTDVFGDESRFPVPIQRQTSIHNRCRHHCPSLPLSFVAALWCHRCELKINQHPKR